MILIFSRPCINYIFLRYHHCLACRITCMRNGISSFPFVILSTRRKVNLNGYSQNRNSFTQPRAEIAQFVSKFQSGPDRIFHMWPQGGLWCGPDWNHIGLWQIRLFSNFVLCLWYCSDYIEIKMPKAKSTWRVRKHRIVGEISYIRIIQIKLS